MYKNVLVPIGERDYCESALKALERAIALCEGEIILLHVCEPLAQTIGGEAREQMEKETDSIGLQVLGPMIELLQSYGVPFHTRILRGTVADTIVQTADESHADLIVMCTDGRDNIADLLLGTITERVLRNTIIDLLVVHI